MPPLTPGMFWRPFKNSEMLRNAFPSVFWGTNLGIVSEVSEVACTLGQEDTGWGRLDEKTGQ